MGAKKIMASNIRGRKKLLRFEVWSLWPLIAALVICSQLVKTNPSNAQALQTVNMAMQIRKYRFRPNRSLSQPEIVSTMPLATR